MPSQDSSAAPPPLAALVGVVRLSASEIRRSNEDVTPVRGDSTGQLTPFLSRLPCGARGLRFEFAGEGA